MSNNKSLVFSFVSRCSHVWCRWWCCDHAVSWACSQLVRPKDAVDPAEKNGVAYRIPCECGKVYIGETGGPMQDRIKEHDRGIRPARTDTSAVSKHAHNTRHKPLWTEVKFIVTLTTTRAGSKRQFIQEFILTTSTGIVE